VTVRTRGDGFGPGTRAHCLGTIRGQYRHAGTLGKTTVDYTGEFARVLHGAVWADGCLVPEREWSDPTGRSRIAFARYKGDAGSANGAIPAFTYFDRYIYPVERAKKTEFSYRLLSAILPVIRVMFPNQVILAETSHLLHPLYLFGPSHGRCRRSGKEETGGSCFEKPMTSELWAASPDTARDVAPSRTRKVRFTYGNDVPVRSYSVPHGFASCGRNKAAEWRCRRN